MDDAKEEQAVVAHGRKSAADTNTDTSTRSLGRTSTLPGTNSKPPVPDYDNDCCWQASEPREWWPPKQSQLAASHLHARPFGACERLSAFAHPAHAATDR